jgi:hypothetical protein
MQGLRTLHLEKTDIDTYSPGKPCFDHETHGLNPLLNVCEDKL